MTLKIKELTIKADFTRSRKTAPNPLTAEKQVDNISHTNRVYERLTSQRKNRER